VRIASFSSDSYNAAIPLKGKYYNNIILHLDTESHHVNKQWRVKTVLEWRIRNGYLLKFFENNTLMMLNGGKIVDKNVCMD